MVKFKKILTLDTVMALMLLLIIGVLAFDGYVISKLPASSLKYPGFVFLTCFIIGSIEICRSILASRKEYEEKPIFKNIKNFIFACITIVIYVSLLNLLGFVASSFIFTAVFAVYHKYNKPIHLIFITSVIVIGIYILFTRFLGVNLPAGIFLPN